MWNVVALSYRSVWGVLVCRACSIELLKAKAVPGSLPAATAALFRTITGTTCVQRRATNFGRSKHKHCGCFVSQSAVPDIGRSSLRIRGGWAVSPGSTDGGWGLRQGHKAVQPMGWRDPDAAHGRWTRRGHSGAVVGPKPVHGRLCPPLRGRYDLPTCQPSLAGNRCRCESVH